MAPSSARRSTWRPSRGAPRTSTTAPTSHQDPRLRPGEEHARRRRADPRWRHHRLAALHGARAGARRGRRPPRRHLIKILDFGLVKSMRGDAELTRDGAIIGSPLYMAPEQGRAEDVDHRADIYS